MPECRPTNDATSVPAALPSYSAPVVLIRLTVAGKRYGRHVSNALSGAVAPSLMEHLMRMTVRAKSARAMIRFVAAIAILGTLGAAPVAAQEGPPHGTLPAGESRFSSGELVNTGHRFFGTVSRGLAQIVEKAISQWGLPNGYILGEEASGAFVAGLRYGEGILYTKNAGDLKVYWQGPSIGFDAGGEGARTMMLVYSLPATSAIYERFGGVDGSAYFIGGFGMTALTANNIVLVPIRSGVGLRLGANIGYLKFTPQATWNPL
jgi:hypothetical protein